MQTRHQDQVKVAVYTADLSESEQQHTQDVQSVVLFGLGAVLLCWLSYCL